MDLFSGSPTRYKRMEAWMKPFFNSTEQLRKRYGLVRRLDSSRVPVLNEPDEKPSWKNRKFVGGPALTTRFPNQRSASAAQQDPTSTAQLPAKDSYQPSFRPKTQISPVSGQPLSYLRTLNRPRIQASVLIGEAGSLKLRCIYHRTETRWNPIERRETRSTLSKTKSPSTTRRGRPTTASSPATSSPRLGLSSSRWKTHLSRSMMTPVSHSERLTSSTTGESSPI
ncbi:hypothetical protein U1Q18_010614 [Sarracenia purpurea var. burkii]